MSIAGKIDLHPVGAQHARTATREGQGGQLAACLAAGPVVGGRVQAFEPRAERVALAADFEQPSYHPRPELLRGLSQRPADSRRYVTSCT